MALSVTDPVDRTEPNDDRSNDGRARQNGAASASLAMWKPARAAAIAFPASMSRVCTAAGAAAGSPIRAGGGGPVGTRRPIRRSMASTGVAPPAALPAAVSGTPVYLRQVSGAPRLPQWLWESGHTPPAGTRRGRRKKVGPRDGRKTAARKVHHTAAVIYSPFTQAAVLSVEGDGEMSRQSSMAPHCAKESRTVHVTHFARNQTNGTILPKRQYFDRWKVPLQPGGTSLVRSGHHLQPPVRYSYTARLADIKACRRLTAGRCSIRRLVPGTMGRRRGTEATRDPSRRRPRHTG